MTKYSPLIGLAIAVLAGCSGQAPTATAPIPVRAQTVEKLGTGRELRYSGVVTPKTQIDLSFKVDGYVRSILQVEGADGRMRPIQQGDAVTRGMKLAVVDEAEYRDKVRMAEANLAKARADLDKAEADYKRASNLYSTQSITAPDYDRAKKDFETGQAAVAGAEAQLDQAKLDLSYCELKAPADGVLLERKIEVGTLVHPGSVGFVLADVSVVTVDFGIPDVMLEHVDPGETLELTTASFPGVRFSGAVTSIAPSADPSSRVFEVQVTVPNRDGRLKDGMIVSLEVGSNATPGSVVVVPLSAVVRASDDAQGYAVFTLEAHDGGQMAKERRVELGPVFGNDVAVTAGLTAGQSVIVNGAKLVSDGDAVRTVP